MPANGERGWIFLGTCGTTRIGRIPEGTIERFKNDASPIEVCRVDEPKFRIGLIEGDLAQSSIRACIEDPGIDPVSAQQPEKDMGVLQTAGSVGLDHFTPMKIGRA